jgi:hypothetical protein
MLRNGHGSNRGCQTSRFWRDFAFDSEIDFDSISCSGIECGIDMVTLTGLILTYASSVFQKLFWSDIATIGIYMTSQHVHIVFRLPVSTYMNVELM